MKAVLLWPRHGNVTVEEVPTPQLRAGQVLIRNHHSLISAGTERARIEAGRQSLLGKARKHPEQVRQVLESVQQVGVADTYRLVSDRLDAPVQVGYSSAGVVLEAGEGVRDLAPGTRVAAAGAGYASHAEVVSVPANLCVPLPDAVPSGAAAFATVGAIALQGIHQADVQPGSRVAIIGLGLVGQLAARLLTAYGCDVIGVDRDSAMLDLAGGAGIAALARDGSDLVAATRAAWGGGGAGRRTGPRPGRGGDRGGRGRGPATFLLLRQGAVDPVFAQLRAGPLRPQLRRRRHPLTTRVLLLLRTAQPGGDRAPARAQAARRRLAATR